MERSKVEIREAVASDVVCISDLMEDALGPFYGGDHRAHAARICRTHLAGGDDKLGFFSLKQKMYVACDGNKILGIIHLVLKRQQTLKISPLIVAPVARRCGVGKKLLTHAEDFARLNNCRQIYCTIADKNDEAKRFFSS